MDGGARLGFAVLKGGSNGNGGEVKVNGEVEVHSFFIKKDVAGAVWLADRRAGSSVCIDSSRLDGRHAGLRRTTRVRARVHSVSV